MAHFMRLILAFSILTSTALPLRAQPASETSEASQSATKPKSDDASSAGASHPATPNNANNEKVDKAEANTPPFINNHYVLTSVIGMNGYHAKDPTLVIVDKGSHSTYVLQLQNAKIVRVLTISNAIGTFEKPTPPGRYRVVRKEKFPKWIPPKTIDKKQKSVAPYNETHKNPLGVAGIFLDKYELALHGTNAPSQIRKSASHGCVRHSNADISRLYGMVDKGDTVMIVRQFKGTVLNRSDFKARAQ
jgi:lipoprotein-anchoring transpeptidase ErfK/SrfK